MMRNYCGEEISMDDLSVNQMSLEWSGGLFYTWGTSCKVEIEAQYSWPNLMYYLDSIDLDCDDGYLEIDGYDYDICGDTKPEGAIALNSDSMKIRYVLKNRFTTRDRFAIVVTAYKDDSCTSYDFRCDNGRCIDRRLRCNGYNSCGDHSSCQVDSLTSGTIAGIVIGSLIAAAVAASLVVVCCCCLRKSTKTRGRMQQPVMYTASPPSLSNPAFSQPTYGRDPANYTYPHTSQHSAQTATAPHQSFAAGAQPSHPANWQPVYQQQPYEKPPPYSEIDHNSASQKHISDNASNSRAEETSQQTVLENYETLANTHDTHAYDKLNTVS